MFLLPNIIEEPLKPFTHDAMKLLWNLVTSLRTSLASALAFLLTCSGLHYLKFLMLFFLTLLPSLYPLLYLLLIIDKHLKKGGPNRGHSMSYYRGWQIDPGEVLVLGVVLMGSEWEVRKWTQRGSIIRNRTSKR